MGVIQYASKWDLNQNAWKTPEGDEIKRSFGIAGDTISREKLFKNTFEKVNYVIVSYGSRIEDHIVDKDHIRDDSFNIDKINAYFSKTTHNVVIEYVMLDADAPLKQDAIRIAEHIIELSKKSNTRTINLVGLSKGGMINMYVPSLLTEDSRKKTSIYNVATPYVGTLMASPLYFYPKVKELVQSKFGDNRSSEIIYKVLINFYESISSNSHMDYDIAMKDGVPSNKLDYYDKTFVENVFSKENIEALKQIYGVHNFVTGISKGVFSRAMKDWDYMAIGLCILNKWFFNGESDGFVKSSEQYIIEDHLDFVKSMNLSSSHVFFNNHELYKVLQCIYDSINEYGHQRKRNFSEDKECK